MIVRKRSEIDHDIHRGGSSVRIPADRSDVDAGEWVGESAARDDGRVVLSIDGPGRGIEQVAATGAAGPGAPVEQHAVLNPFVAGKFLAHFHPVKTRVFLDLQGVRKVIAQRRSVKGVNAVEAAVGDGGDVGVGQPLEDVLFVGIELVVAGRRRAHRVERVPVFDVAARADDGVAGRIPVVGVPEAVVVAELMAGDPDAGAGLQPGSLAADVAASAPAGEHAFEMSAVEVEVRRVESVGLGDGAGVAEEREVVVVGLIPGLGVGHGQQRRDGGVDGGVAVGRFRKPVADTVHQVGGRRVGNRFGEVIGEIQSHEEHRLRANGPT